MERSWYWTLFNWQMGEATVMGGGDRHRPTPPAKVAIVYGGRELSPEAYLAVPTFLRRGLRPEV